MRNEKKNPIEGVKMIKLARWKDLNMLYKMEISL